MVVDHVVLVPIVFESNVRLVIVRGICIDTLKTCADGSILFSHSSLFVNYRADAGLV